MRKMNIFRRVISFLLVLLLLPLTLSPTQATETIHMEKRVITDQEYYPADYAGYLYPIRPGTAAWESLADHQAMVDACMIPDNILKTMSTDALIQSILSYPLIADIFAYTDWTYGLQIVTKNFNGLEEFSSRTDSGASIVKVILSQPVITEDLLDKETVIAFNQNSSTLLNADYSICRTILHSMVLSVMLCETKYSDRISTTDKQLLADTITKKSNASVNYSVAPPAPLHTNIVVQDATRAYTYVYQYGYTPYPLSTVSLTAPNGSAVTGSTNVCAEVWYCSDGTYRIKPDAIYEDIPAAYKTTINNAFYNTYGINPIADPTVKYNCHSYAWYTASSSNSVWINDPSPYLSDGSYTVVNFASAAVGDRIVYYESTNGTYQSPTHSARLYSITNGKYILRSKWGMSGLYTHNITNCPYYYTNPESGSGSIYDFRCYRRVWS